MTNTIAPKFSVIRAWGDGHYGLPEAAKALQQAGAFRTGVCLQMRPASAPTPAPASAYLYYFVSGTPRRSSLTLNGVAVTDYKGRVQVGYDVWAIPTLLNEQVKAAAYCDARAAQTIINQIDGTDGTNCYLSEQPPLGPLSSITIARQGILYIPQGSAWDAQSLGSATEVASAYLQGNLRVAEAAGANRQFCSHFIENAEHLTYKFGNPMTTGLLHAVPPLFGGTQPTLTKLTIDFFGTDLPDTGTAKGSEAIDPAAQTVPETLNPMQALIDEAQTHFSRAMPHELVSRMYYSSVQSEIRDLAKDFFFRLWLANGQSFNWEPAHYRDGNFARVFFNQEQDQGGTAIPFDGPVPQGYTTAPKETRVESSATKAGVNFIQVLREVNSQPDNFKVIGDSHGITLGRALFSRYKDATIALSVEELEERNPATKITIKTYPGLLVTVTVPAHSENQTVYSGEFTISQVWRELSAQSIDNLLEIVPGKSGVYQPKKDFVAILNRSPLSQTERERIINLMFRLGAKPSAQSVEVPEFQVTYRYKDAAWPKVPQDLNAFFEAEQERTAQARIRQQVEDETKVRPSSYRKTWSSGSTLDWIRSQRRGRGGGGGGSSGGGYGGGSILF